MPIYEYYCPRCELKFERLRPVSQADAEALCPSCNGPGRRTLSLFASFSRSAQGVTSPIAGSTPSCSACSATSCDTCG